MTKPAPTVVSEGLHPHPFGMLTPGRSWEIGSGEGYRFGFGGKENTDEFYGDEVALDFGARIYDSRLGRWLSVDPFIAKYPSHSPYAFGLNNPIVIIDKEGEDNVIYLVYLPGSENTITIDQVKEIINIANLNFESLGVKTRVVLATEACGCNINEFNPNNPGISKETDAIAIIGGGADVINYTAKISTIFSNQLTAKGFGNGNFADISFNPKDVTYGDPNSPKIIALDPLGIQKKTTSTNLTSELVTLGEYGALTVNHGAGHTAGAQHVGDADFPSGPHSPEIYTNTGYTVSVIMNPATDGEFIAGDPLKDAIEKYGYEAVVSDRSDVTQTIMEEKDGRKFVRTTTLNPDYDTYIKSAYGDNDSKVNYEK